MIGVTRSLIVLTVLFLDLNMKRFGKSRPQPVSCRSDNVL